MKDGTVLLLSQVTPAFNGPCVYAVLEDLGLVEQGGKNNVLHGLIWVEARKGLAFYLAAGAEQWALWVHTVVGQRKIWEVFGVLVGSVRVYDGDGIAVGEAGDIDVLGGVDVHLVGRGNVITLGRDGDVSNAQARRGKSRDLHWGAEERRCRKVVSRGAESGYLMLKFGLGERGKS